MAMPMSYPVFFTLYSVAIVVGIVIGLLLTVGWKNIDRWKALRSVRSNAGYLAIVAGLPLLIQLQGLAEQLLGIEPDPVARITYTTWIYNLSGGPAIGVLQDRLDYRIFAYLFMLVYAWLFTYLLYFTPILLLVRDDRLAFRKYTIAMAFNYVVLIPFYTFFPVSVSGSYPEAGITPLLYIDAHWGKMVTSVDPLDNDFPSGHVSLIATALLIVAAAGPEYRRFYYFVLGSTAAVVFAVLYLGVHWPPDVLAGFALAFAAVWFASNEKVQRSVDRLVSRFTSLFVRKSDASPGGNRGEIGPVEDARSTRSGEGGDLEGHEADNRDLEV